MYKYEVRFTSVSDGEDFAAEHKVCIEWINDTDEFNRAIVTCRENIYRELMDDERVVQFSKR